MEMKPAPLAGGAYQDESRPWSQQDCLNLRVQTAEVEGTRSPQKLSTLPGLRPFVELSGTGSVRGLHDVEGKLVGVMGGTAYYVRNEVAIPLGDVPGTGRVQIDHNQISLGNEAVFVNGSAGYCWNTRTNAFGRITDPGFPGGAVVRFVDGYMVVIEPQGRYAASSAPAQATEWNTLDRWTSEVSPDRLMAAGVRGSELLLLSATSGEFFQSTSNLRQPFRTKRASFKKGCPSPHAVVEADSTIFFLGHDGVFYVVDGYSARRISTRPIERAIAGLNWNLCFGFLWDTTVYWTFPDGRTWGYDIPEGQWHRRESWGLNRWRVNAMTRHRDEWVAGDFQAKRLWHCNEQDEYFLEGSTPYVCRRAIPVMHANQMPVSVPRLELLMSVGQSETVPEDFPVQPESPAFDHAPLSEMAWVGDEFTLATGYADGGTAPLIYSISPNDTLPAGLAIDPETGEITGTPTTAGEYAFAVRVTDANGLWAELDVDITVTAVATVGWDAGVVGDGVALEQGRRVIAAVSELPGDFGGSRSLKALTGKSYVSGRLLLTDDSNALGVGIADATEDYADPTVYVGQSADSLGVWADGDVLVNGVSVGSVGALPEGVESALEFAVDTATREVWVRLDGGAWVGGGDPTTATTPTAVLGGSGDLYLAGSIDLSPTLVLPLAVRIDSTVAETSGTPPSGFTAANWEA